MLVAQQYDSMTCLIVPRTGQHSGGGRLRAVTAHGGRQARGQVVAG